MSQNVNLQVAGLYTAPSDLNGLPPGSLEVAMNVESRHKNLIESRRGFEELVGAEVVGTTFKRMTNFPVLGDMRTVVLNSAGDLYYYNGSAMVALPGINSGILKSDDLAKPRFIRGGQNLYVTSSTGIKSMASASGSEMIRAGVPVGLNIEGSIVSGTSGFFTNNTVLDTTGTMTASSASITGLASTSLVAVGQYISGQAKATVTIQNVVYTAQAAGTGGNSITVANVNNGVSLPLTITVVSNAITVQLATNGGGTPTSTATDIVTAINLDNDASALVLASTSSGGTVQAVAAATPLANGSDSNFPDGTTILEINESAILVEQLATTTAGSASITVASNASGGIVAGVLVTGAGLVDGTEVVSISGAGPYTVVLSNACYLTNTTEFYTFSTKPSITASQNATYSSTDSPISIYAGSNVAYRMVFGRVENDIDGNSVTRLGAPSSMVVVTNNTGTSKNVTVTATLPKNAQDDITFLQLYRSFQSATVSVQPLDQMQLVYERTLVAGDFTTRTVTVVDSTTDDFMGLALYSGSDQEGILQANSPPPSAWDMGVFRDIALYANTTQPATLDFTILATGASSGIQVGDTFSVTVAGGSPVVYTAAAAEVPASREFKVYTGGDVAQDIVDTAKSLIKVINYDESLSVHAIYSSTVDGLPGKVTLQGDYPNITFTATASAHATAYDPTMTNVACDLDRKPNGIYVSKSGKLESVPAANVLFVGDSSQPIYRVIPLRDYAIVLKGDGIYKIVGTSPNSLQVLPFDLTTQVIGPDTAVSFNSGVWMLSDQGVVSISDAGVNAISIPIDDQINTLVGSIYDNLNNTSFAVGYESDRKYILCVPENSLDGFSTLQYCYNYVTNTWTNWDRKIASAYINSEEGKLYIARADDDFKNISKERKSGTYTDFVDESITVTISSVTSSTSVVLSSVTNVAVGDILYQTTDTLSPITAIDLLTNTVTTQFSMSWAPGSATVLSAIDCTITWKQVFGDNPAFTRQFSEGLVLFKNTRFNTATMDFKTDFSQNTDTVTLEGTLLGSWGLFGWGENTWGGMIAPSSIRFLVPQNKQYGSYIIPTLNIHQGWSNFKLQGLSLSFNNISQEVGK